MILRFGIPVAALSLLFLAGCGETADRPGAERTPDGTMTPNGTEPGTTRPGQNADSDPATPGLNERDPALENQNPIDPGLQTPETQRPEEPGGTSDQGGTGGRGLQPDGTFQPPADQDPQPETEPETNNDTDNENPPTPENNPDVEE